MTKLIGILMMVGLVVGVFNGCGHLINTHTEKYDNGKVSGEGNYIDGKEEGKTVEYYESGEVKLEGNYVDEKFEGKWVRYYQSGEVEWEGNYSGVEVRLGPGGEGKSVWYYESGKVFWERNYVDGKREGKFFDYDEDGNILDEDIW